jgi:hypothetical protein
MYPKRYHKIIHTYVDDHGWVLVDCRLIDIKFVHLVFANT